jgi:hypothetical protein
LGGFGREIYERDEKEGGGMDGREEVTGAVKV